MLRWLACFGLVACTDAAAPGMGPPWTEAPDLPDGERRLEPGVAALGTRLVIAGGFATSAREGLQLTREVMAFDTATGAWISLPDLPFELSHINLAAVGGSLYLLGGLEGARFTAHGEAFVLRPDADAWEATTPMPAGLERGAAGVVVGPGHIYLLGGAGTTQSLASCLDFDVAHETWSQLPDLPHPRSHPAAMRMPDATLVVAGGLATLDSTMPLADVFTLPPGAPAWQGGHHPMLTARGGCAYGQALGRLVCAGGEAGNNALAAVEAYDPYADVWIQMPDMPAPRAGTQGAMIGQQLYVPGGAEILAFEPTSTVFVFSSTAVSSGDTAP